MASVLGIISGSKTDYRIVTSVRGEKYKMIASGLYKYNSQRMVAEGIGWDYFTLIFALPMLLLLLPRIYKNSLRAKLFAVGLLAYVFYQYFMYALGWAFGPLFPLFILIYSFSLICVIWIISTIDITELSQKINDSFPRKSIAFLCFFVAVLIFFMWLKRIAVGLQGDLQEGILLGQTTMVIQALDLGLIVPFAVFTGIFIIRRKEIGYLLSPVLLVKAIAMSGAIMAMLISAWIAEGGLDITPFVLFLIIFIISIILGVKTFQSIKEKDEK
ncbi:MAG TPA: hypothetical protein ENG70_00715 [Candidatus Cloacimonetes bacterium]|nr:hypothetical protein [Candidatus Cloacimonadota bacterium]HEX37376.1 hypothetical protein [Candidatus Cloacimonadota bacterium]